ncbi:MAG: hypothetical protein ABR568_23380, partial [Pyrinomonadaceae bacterium]
MQRGQRRIKEKPGLETGKLNSFWFLLSVFASFASLRANSFFENEILHSSFTPLRKRRFSHQISINAS